MDTPMDTSDFPPSASAVAGPSHTSHHHHHPHPHDEAPSTDVTTTTTTTFLSGTAPVFRANASAMQRPTLTNVRIRSTRDAQHIFYAVALNRLPMTVRRLDAEERRAIVSGNVYVWEERGANSEATGLGIERWTDGMRWSPSRVRDDFLFYHQKDMDADEAADLPPTRWARIVKPKNSPGADAGSSSPSSGNVSPGGGVPHQRPSTDPQRLIKQTYSVIVSLPDDARRGIMRKWHLTAYFTQGTVEELLTVDQQLNVSAVVVPEGWFRSARSGKARREQGRQRQITFAHSYGPDVGGAAVPQQPQPPPPPQMAPQQPYPYPHTHAPQQQQQQHSAAPAFAAAHQEQYSTATAGASSSSSSYIPHPPPPPSHPSQQAPAQYSAFRYEYDRRDEVEGEDEQMMVVVQAEPSSSASASGSGSASVGPPPPPSHVHAHAHAHDHVHPYAHASAPPSSGPHSGMYTVPAPGPPPTHHLPPPSYGEDKPPRRIVVDPHAHPHTQPSNSSTVSTTSITPISPRSYFHSTYVPSGRDYDETSSRAGPAPLRIVPSHSHSHPHSYTQQQQHPGQTPTAPFAPPSSSFFASRAPPAFAATSRPVAMSVSSEGPAPLPLSLRVPSMAAQAGVAYPMPGTGTTVPSSTGPLPPAVSAPSTLGVGSAYVSAPRPPTPTGEFGPRPAPLWHVETAFGSNDGNGGGWHTRPGTPRTTPLPPTRAHTPAALSMPVYGPALLHPPMALAPDAQGCGREDGDVDMERMDDDGVEGVDTGMEVDAARQLVPLGALTSAAFVRRDPIDEMLLRKFNALRTTPPPLSPKVGGRSEDVGVPPVAVSGSVGEEVLGGEV